MRKTYLWVVFGVVLALSGAVGAAEPFQQLSTDGLVFIEAEDFSANVPQGGKTFELVTDQPGYSGTGAMQSLPNSGTNKNTGFVTGSPHLDFQINFTQTGVHYVWVRGFAHGSGSDDSGHSGLDGQVVDTADRINFSSAADWLWTNADMDGGRVRIDVATAGLHTFNLYMREDGLEYDKVVLTTNADFKPTGLGPAWVATGPSPANGAIDITAPLFQWTAGVNALMDDVYFGTTADLGAAEFKGKQPSAMALFFYMGILEPGVKYYWRVDTTDSSGTLRKGTVWSFTVMPVKATEPSPGDGATFVVPEPTLGWKAGQNTPTHDVYFGADKAAVAAGDAGVFKGNQVDNSFKPGLLERSTTYYWRVDEIDVTGVKSVGDVWSFTTTLPGLGTAKRQVWTSIGGTAVSALFNDVNFPYAPKFTDEVPEFRTPTNFADNYGGRLSAWLHVPVAGDYTFSVASDDDSQLFFGPHPGKVKMIASVAGWTNDQEWGKYGSQKSAVQTLQAGVYFIEAFWKEGGGGDNCAAAWQGPGISRQVIGGGYLEPSSDLWAVRPNPADGATGVYFAPELKWVGSAKATGHDVYFGGTEAAVAGANTKSKEYKGRVAVMSFKPGDLTLGNTYYWRVDEVNDAVADSPWKGAVWSFTVSTYSLIDDFEAYEFQPVAPAKGPIGWWKLDGTLDDSSGKGHNGKIVGDGIGFIDDPVKGKVLDLPGGDNKYVEIGSVGLSGNMPTTIACWAKANSTTIPDWTLVFGFTGKADGTGGNGSHFNIDSIGGPGGVGAHVWGWEETIFTDAQALEWHHYAMTYDGTTIRYYGDGLLRDTDVGKSNVRDLKDRGDRVHIGKRVTQASSFPGNIADARVYDYALSGPEIASIAGYVPKLVLPDAWKGDKVVQASLANNAVHGGGQSLKLKYNTRIVPCAGAASATPPYKDLTRGGANAISIWVQGAPNNYTDWLIVAVMDTGGAMFPATYKDMSGLSSGEWKNWTVPLKLFSANGVKTNSAAKVGVGALAGRPGPGTFYVDDIRLIKQ